MEVEAVYYKWLDRWDDRRTRRRDDVKVATDMVLDTNSAFPEVTGSADLDNFCIFAERAVRSSDAFFSIPDRMPKVRWQDNLIQFPSSISTGTPENDVVHAHVTMASTAEHAVIVFHHWNASSRNKRLARFFAARGMTVFEMALPYHLERTRPGAAHADDILSPNLGRTIQSMHQAVADGRHLVRIVQAAGYKKISVLGMSLGSWVAGLVAAHDPAVSKASLLLNGGDLAEMVWTGSATRHIRASLDGRLKSDDLKRAWAPLNLENHVDKLARPELDLQIVLAARDKVVPPAVSERFVNHLKNAGASLTVKRLNCGHYSLTLPPYIISTGISAARFLNR